MRLHDEVKGLVIVFHPPEMLCIPSHPHTLIEPMHEEAAAAPETDAPKAANSVQLGYKTFTDGNEAYQYFSYLLSKLTHNQDINEYEHQSLLALLEKGHVNATEKVHMG